MDKSDTFVVHEGLALNFCTWFLLKERNTQIRELVFLSLYDLNFKLIISLRQHFIWRINCQCSFSSCSCSYFFHVAFFFKVTHCRCPLVFFYFIFYFVADFVKHHWFLFQKHVRYIFCLTTLFFFHPVREEGGHISTLNRRHTTLYLSERCNNCTFLFIYRALGGKLPSYISSLLLWLIFRLL